MRICFDLDGTICYTRKENESYSDVEPIPGAIETLRKLKTDGHYIIIHTARHVKTCNNNLGMIVAKQGKTLFDWLDKHQIPYDEIWFGKPLADLYVDDKGLKFNSWVEIDKELIK